MQLRFYIFSPFQKYFLGFDDCKFTLHLLFFSIATYSVIIFVYDSSPIMPLSFADKRVLNNENQVALGVWICSVLVSDRGDRGLFVV
jgi:hypothetical protein